MLGLGRSTALAAAASFVASHPLFDRALVLPVETAREIGDALLAGRIVLLGLAGIACAALLRALGLPRAALIGGALYELAASSDGTGDRHALATLIVCPFFLASLERVLRGLQPSTLRLAVAISLVAAADATVAEWLLFAFGLAWSIVRIASPATVRRGRVFLRLSLATAAGALLASPFLVPRLLAGALDFGPWVTLPNALDGWWRFGHAGSLGAGSARAALTIIQILPLLALAGLAAVRPRPRGRALTALLAAAAAIIAILPAIGADTLSDGSARPLFLTCLVVLIAVPLNAAPARVPYGPLAPVLTATALCAAAILLGGRAPLLALANAAAACLCAGLSWSGWQRAAAGPALASAAWTAISIAS